MRSPEEWTPENAEQARAWVESNPDDRSAKDQLAKYDRLQALTALSRPSELMPPEQPGLKGTLHGFRRYLPSSVGGTVERWQDPSKEEFLKLVGGEKALPKDVNVDQLYRDYTDARWSQEYDRAKAEGRGLQRASKHGFAEDYAPAVEKGLEGVEGVTMKALRGSTVVGPAAVRALGTGVDKALEGLGVDARPGAEANKILTESEASIPMAVGLPVEIASGLATGPIGTAAKGLSSALTFGRGPLARILGSGAAGVALGPTLGAASDVAEGVADKLQGTGTLPTVDQELEKAPGRALTGGALGAAGGTVGELAGILPGLNRSNKSALGRDLKIAEQAGVQTSPLSKLKAPPAMEATFDTLKPGTNAVDVAADKALPGVKNETTSRVERTIRPIEEANGRYYATKEGSAENAHLGPMVRATVEMLDNRSYAEGQAPEGKSDLPIFDNRALRDLLPRMADAEVMPDHKAATGEISGGVKVNLDKAQRLGIVPQGLKVTVPRQEPRADLNPLFRWSRGSSSSETLPPTPEDSADLGAFEERANRGPGMELDARNRNIGHMVATRSPQPQPMYETIPLEEALATGRVNPRGYSLLFKARKVNAETADSLINEADRAAGISEMQGGGKSDPMWQRFVNAARQVRDQFGDNEVTAGVKPVTIPGPHGEPITIKGWSALKHQHAEQLGQLRADLRRMGVPGGAPDADLNDAVTEDALLARMRRYGSGDEGSGKTTDAFDRTLEGTPSHLGLRQVPGTRVYQELMEPGNVHTTRAGLADRAIRSARLRLDSPLSFVARQGGPAGAAAAGDISLNEYERLLRLAKQLQGTHP